MKYTIKYDERDTTPDYIDQLATKFGITPEQVIKRSIAQYIGQHLGSNEPCLPGKNLQDFLVKNGMIKPKECIQTPKVKEK